MNEGGMLRAFEQEFLIDRQRRSNTQALSGLVVDLIGNVTLTQFLYHS
jgi:hypothetical protein